MPSDLRDMPSTLIFLRESGSVSESSDPIFFDNNVAVKENYCRRVLWFQPRGSCPAVRAKPSQKIAHLLAARQRRTPLGKVNTATSSLASAGRRLLSETQAACWICLMMGIGH